METVLVSALLAALVAAVLVGVLLLLYLKRSSPGAAAGPDFERVRALEADVVGLREAKAEAERRLAAESEKASRVLVLERDLSDRSRQLDVIRDAKAAADQDLARAKTALEEAGKAVVDARTRITSLEAVREAKAKVDEALATKSEAIARVEKEAADLQQRLEAAKVQHDDLNSKLVAAALQKADLQTQLASTQETLTQERRQSGERIALLNDARERMTKEFKLLAEEVMARHGETFAKQNKEQVEVVLKPLRDKLAEFQTGLQEARTESTRDKATLAEHIRQLTESSAKMSTETHNLTRALKGKAQTQGAWGEMVLATILERSGLRKGEEYVTQESHTGEEGGRVRPDVVVNLPGGQRVVIDSKVSLTAFEAYVNADSDAERAVFLSSHVASMKSHIKALGAKSYQSVVGSGLDYVVMFVPIEGALAVAMQEEPSLTSLAADANVAIATPTTLMIALRTVANVWQVERRNRNAEAIAERAGKLYDKFVGFLDDMGELGNRLQQARVSYDGAMGKLAGGRGNLVRQVEQLKELGAKTGRTIPPGLLDDVSAEPDTPTAGA